MSTLTQRRTLVPVPWADTEEIRRAVMAKSAAEQSEYVFNVPIHTSNFISAVKAIDFLVNRVGETVHPGGLRLHGEGGTGKSFILDFLIQRYPERFLLRGIQRPIVTISLLEGPNPASIRRDLLHAVGYAGSLRGTSAKDQDDLIRDAFIELDTRLLVIDEAGHLVASSRRLNTERLAGPCGDYLKVLYDKLKVPFVFLGTSGISTLIRQDPQLESRWRGDVHLHHYQNDQQWNALLGALDQALPFEQLAGLNSKSFSNALYATTQGNLRSLKRLVSDATLHAAKRLDRQINFNHFAEAFDLQCPIGTNPFREAK